jgi:hypothetical protein
MSWEALSDGLRSWDLAEDQVWRVGALPDGLIYMSYLVTILASQEMRSNAQECVAKCAVR